MIFITIQGTGSDGKHESIKDGAMLSGAMQQDEISKLLNFIKINKINANIDNVFVYKQGKYFCTMPHNIKDSNNRVRLAMILWENCDNNTIKENLGKMGLDYNIFMQRYNNFRMRKNIKIGALIAIVLAFIAYIFSH